MKAGVIGCGVVARKAHLPAYHSLGVDLVGVADSTKERARFCARKFRVKKWFADYKDLLREDLDLVSLCTPPSTHSQLTIDAAKAGINVVVEKPMATNAEDAESMIGVCNASGVKLCVVHNYRFFPCVLEAKKRLEEGRIGKIVSVHAIGHDFIDLMDSPWRFEKWGVLEDLGPHVIDMVSFLCNSSIKNVKVIARDYTENMGCLSHIQSILLFQNGACVDIDLSWITGAFELSLKILGTAGTLNIDVRNNHLREIHGYSTPLEELGGLFKKSFKIAKAVVDRTYFSGPLQYHRLIIRKFVESIIKGTNPPVSGHEGKEVVAMIDSIKKRVR